MQNISIQSHSTLYSSLRSFNMFTMFPLHTELSVMKGRQKTDGAIHKNMCIVDIKASVFPDHSIAVVCL